MYSAFNHQLVTDKCIFALDKQTVDLDEDLAYLNIAAFSQHTISFSILKT